jgi:hypothetical protein
MLLLYWLHDIQRRLVVRRRTRCRRLKQRRLPRKAWHMGSAAEQLETRLMLSPTVLVPGAQTVKENQSLTLSGASGISVLDTGANGATDQVALTIAHGTLTLGSRVAFP